MPRARSPSTSRSYTSNPAADTAPRPRGRVGAAGADPRPSADGEHPHVVVDQRDDRAVATDAVHPDAGAADDDIRVDDGLVDATGEELSGAGTGAAVEAEREAVAPGHV